MSTPGDLKALSDRIECLHHEAMVFADDAVAAKRVGAPVETVELLWRQALACERESAELCASGPYAVEPTRSVLYRSAASLAMECGEQSEAERLARAGLAGEPPEEIAEELREILGQAEASR